jgi:hypothetical protein
MSDHFIVHVTFDRQRGYVASHPDLPSVTALSLAHLRRRVEGKLRGEQADIRLVLDKRARQERDRAPSRWAAAAVNQLFGFASKASRDPADYPPTKVN